MNATTPTRAGRRKFAAAIAAITLSAGVAGGVVASQFVVADQPAPAGTSATPDGAPSVAAQSDYPVNERGETYGVADDNVAPADWPDLILVEATNGAEGYVARDLLAEATGANVATPEEAVAWQREMDEATWETVEIPVVLADGRTEAGSFPVSRSTIDK